MVKKSRHFNEWLWAVILFLFAFMIYANSIPHEYVLDDYSVLKDNFVVKRGVEGIPLIMKTPYRYGVGHLTDNIYRPLTLVMFAIEWQIAPNKPALSHFVNVFFFALSCGMLLFLLRRLFTGYSPLLSLFICFLWAAHPIHTEVVANIKSRDEIMSDLFLMTTILSFIKYLRGHHVFWLLFSVILYFISFLFKEGVVTFIILFPLIGWYFTKAKAWKNILASTLMILPALIYILIRQWIWSKYYVPPYLSVADNLLMVAPNLASRMATAIMILGKYLLLLFVPYQLVSDYSFNQIPVTSWGDPSVWLSFLIYSFALVYSIYFIRKKSVFVFGILVYLVALSIYSNLFTLIGSSFAERFLFLPSVGFAIISGWLIVKLFKIVRDNSTDESPKSLLLKNRTAWLIIGAIVLLYSVKTIARNSEWKNQLSLFSVDVKRSPNSTHMRYYWGLTVRDKAKEQADTAEYRRLMTEAIGQFDTAVMIYPPYPECYEQLGLAWFRLNDFDKSIKYYNEAIRLNPMNAMTYSNMGMIYFLRKDYQKTLELYQKSIAIDSNYDDAYLNIGSTYGTLGQFDLAIKNFKKCLEFKPGDAQLFYYIGISYRSLKNDAEAKKYLDKAYAINPGLKK